MLSFIQYICATTVVFAAQPEVLFDGTNLDSLQFESGGWTIDNDGNLTCEIKETKQPNGKVRRTKGYIWTKQQFEDFELTLSYKLSKAANSGVFFRTDKDNPVQAGFEIQLMDNAGFQAVKGKKDPKNLNGAFYDCQAATSDTQNPIGEWNTLKLTCEGSTVTLEINGEVVNKADIDRWDTPKKNPDGSSNKFGTALKDLPRKGHIGFQNHGDQVWFRNVKIRTSAR